MTTFDPTQRVSVSSARQPATSLVPVDDTALAMTDTGGAGQPVVYLNGAYSSQPAWRRVIAELGDDWRHITFDERARGRSRKSADYSFDACLRDLDAVLDATGATRPILVGWSYGAAVAVRWASQHPGRVRGLVLVDGGFPHDWLDDAGRDRIRTLFRRQRPLLPLVARLGLAARMSAAQHAEVNIEINEVFGALGPHYDRLACPVRFVVATGASLGGTESEFAQTRATLDPVLARNRNIQVTATVGSSHLAVLRKDFRAVAQAVHETDCAR